MNTQACQEIYQEAFEDELEKIAISPEFAAKKISKGLLSRFKKNISGVLPTAASTKQYQSTLTKLLKQVPTTQKGRLNPKQYKAFMESMKKSSKGTYLHGLLNK